MGSHIQKQEGAGFMDVTGVADQTRYDALIVGFGPVGAVAANLLGQAGMRVLVIEKTPDIFPKPRAIALDHEILRIFDNIGAHDAIKPYLEAFTASVHYGVDGEPIRIVDMAQPPYPMGYVPSQVFLQPPVERALRDNLARFASVHVSLGEEFLAVEQDGSEARVTTRLPDGHERVVRAAYVIGCDGASSAVRKASRMSLQDLGFDEPWLVIDVLVNERGLAKLPRTSAQYCNGVRPATYVIGPSNLRRWEITILPGEDPKACEREEEVWRLLSPWLSPDDGELWRASSYRFHALVAEPWRDGRVFIAGDAAHQQPPFIGQGMCQGVRDAANLAWKLIDVLGGVASPSLLDTYGQERAAHVRELTGRIKAIGQYISERDPQKARARDERLRAEGGGKAPTVTRQEIVPPLAQGFLDAASAPPAGSLFPQPFVQTPQGLRLLDDVAGAGWRFVVRDACPDAEALARADGMRVLRFAAKAADGYTEAEGVLAAWFARAGVCAALVRPDHYVYGVADTPAAATALVRRLIDARQGNS